MVEPKFLFELLLGLITNPSGFDRDDQHLERSIGRQVRHIVVLLAGRPPLADEPDLVTRHALDTIIERPMLMAIRNPHTAGREEACQMPLPFPDAS